MRLVTAILAGLLCFTRVQAAPSFAAPSFAASSAANTGDAGAKNMGFDPQMMMNFQSKMLAYIKSKGCDVASMAPYYMTAYKSETLNTLINKFATFCPTSEQAEINKMIQLGLTNNDDLVDKIVEISAQVAALAKKAGPILKNRDQTISQMQEKFKALIPTDPDVLIAAKGLVQPIVQKQMMINAQEAMTKIGGVSNETTADYPGNAAIDYAPVVDYPTDVKTQDDIVSIQVEPQTKAEKKAAKKAAKQAAKEAAAEKAAKKAAKKEAKMVKTLELAAPSADEPTETAGEKKKSKKVKVKETTDDATE